MASVEDFERESERQIAADSLARRAQFALGFSRLMAAAGILIPGAMVILWLFFPGAPQLLVFAALLSLMLVGWGLYPVFYRRGRVMTGFYFALASFWAVVAFGSLIMPDAMTGAAIGYLALIVMGNHLLGNRRGLWLIGICILTFAIDLIVSNAIAPDWFIPLDTSALLIAGVFIGLIAFPIAAFIIRLLVNGQEEQYRRAQLATMEVERRAAIEQTQRQQLEQANQAIAQQRAVEQEQRTLLEQIINQVRESASRLNQAAAEILSTTTAQMASVTEQEAAVTQTMAIVDQVLATVQQTAARAQAVADSAQQSVDVSRQGEKAVVDSADGMRFLQGRVTAIAENILALSERTQQIGEIIASVNEIAEQSKLLALNASIEAARAGEEGRGFAVVAVEVRQLAEQSRQATARVSDILHEIQQATNTAVMVTEEGSKSAASGMALVGRAGEAIQGLTDTIEEAAQTALQISTSTQQQASGIEQLAVAMLTIRQASTQTAASTRQAERSAQDLKEMANQMEQLIEQTQQ